MIKNKKLIYGVLIIAVLIIGGIYLFISSKPTTPSNAERVVVSGYVVNGGDIKPEGLLDTPRKFVYKIETNDGSFMDVTYIAYPPTPIGGKEKK